jgi:uncharacterized protein (DUF952 family)
LADFDIDDFLAQPLTARVATNGPTIRPTWYLSEDEAFWILSGPWAKLLGRVTADPAVAVTVDVCDISTGSVRQLIARGRADILPFDVARGRRMLGRYLGREEAGWDTRFRHYLHEDPSDIGTVWIHLRPTSLTASDLSYTVPGRIYHLAVEDEWRDVVDRGAPYRRSTLGQSLDEVGFIHCSFRSQVQAVADLVYRGRPDTLLLTLDPTLLGAEMRLETLPGGHETYPHIYGEIPLEAVVGVDPVPLDGDGKLALAALLPPE